MPPEQPAQPEPEQPIGPPPPPGQDLSHVRQPGESEADFMLRTRHAVVDSQSPADIVPNQPQISMGPPAPGPEPGPTEPEPQPKPEPEPEPAPTPRRRGDAA